MATPSAPTIPRPLPEGRYIPSPFDAWNPREDQAVIQQRKEFVKRLRILHSVGNGLLAATVECHPDVFTPRASSQVFEFTGDFLPEEVERVRVSHVPILGGVSTWSCIAEGGQYVTGKSVLIEHEQGRLAVYNNQYQEAGRELTPVEQRQDPLGSATEFVSTIEAIRSLTSYLQTKGVEPSAILPS